MGIVYLLLALVVSVSLWFLDKNVISKKLIESTRKYPYTKFEVCNPPLGTFNGIGFTLMRGGRHDFGTNSQAWYLFFVILFIPIFPVGCCRATQVDSSGKGNSYRIYGYEKWSIWEVLSIYINSYIYIVGVALLLMLIFFIISFFVVYFG